MPQELPVFISSSWGKQPALDSSGKHIHGTKESAKSLGERMCRQLARDYNIHKWPAVSIMDNSDDCRVKDEYLSIVFMTKTRRYFMED